MRASLIDFNKLEFPNYTEFIPNFPFYILMSYPNTQDFKNFTHFSQNAQKCGIIHCDKNIKALFLTNFHSFIITNYFKIKLYKFISYFLRAHFCELIFCEYFSFSQFSQFFNIIFKHFQFLIFCRPKALQKKIQKFYVADPSEN